MKTVSYDGPIKHKIEYAVQARKQRKGWYRFDTMNCGIIAQSMIEKFRKAMPTIEFRIVCIETTETVVKEGK